MKRMSVKAMQQANGGRWKCNYCGQISWTITGVKSHQILRHNAGSSWIPYWYVGMSRPFNYSWCW